MKAKPKEISLEGYLSFLHSDRAVNYTINQLNQIVSMHGFKKIARTTEIKRRLTDAVKTMELIDPARCTLKENVSSRAVLELDEVVADLSAMKWHECCIIAVQTLSKEDPQGGDKASSPKHTTTVAKPQSQTEAPNQEEELGDDPNATAAIEAPPSKKRLKKMDATPPSKKRVR